MTVFTIQEKPSFTPCLAVSICEVLEKVLIIEISVSAVNQSNLSPLPDHSGRQVLRQDKYMYSVSEKPDVFSLCYRQGLN